MWVNTFVYYGWCIIFIFIQYHRRTCIAKSVVQTIRYDATLVMYHHVLALSVSSHIPIARNTAIIIQKNLHSHRYWQETRCFYGSKFPARRHPKRNRPIHCHIRTEFLLRAICMCQYSTRSWHRQIYQSAEATEIRRVSLEVSPMKNSRNKSISILLQRSISRRRT